MFRKSSLVLSLTLSPSALNTTENRKITDFIRGVSESGAAEYHSPE